MERDMHTVADITSVYSEKKSKRKLWYKKVGLLNSIEVVKVVTDFLLSVGKY